MRRLFASIAVILFGTILFIANPSCAEDPACGIAKDAFQAAQEIRGLRARQAVPCTLQTKEAVLAFFKDTVKRKIPEKKLHNEARIYKALGLIPESYNYLEELLKLYSEQAGGYYDPEANRYVMAAWLPTMLQPAIAAHELTHALQDQYYNLDRFMDDTLYSNDEMLAHSALVEGDATAVMNDFQIGARKESAIAQMKSVEAILLQTVIGSALTQSAAKAPEVVRNMMIFPYVSGLRFVHYFMQKGGYKELERLYRMPPHSTSEILHPELYPMPLATLEREVVVKVLQGETPVFQDTMGEFFTVSWLSSGMPDKKAAGVAAAGLLTDTAYVMPNQKVIWVTLWSSKQDVQEFLKASHEVVAQRNNIKSSCNEEDLSCVIETVN